MSEPVPATLTTCTLLLAGIIVLANLVAASYGLDSIRMVQAFSLDEGHYIAKMKDSLEQFSLDPDNWFYYGNLYDSIGYYCVVFLERFGWTINTPLVGFVLRLISLVSGLLAALTLWKLGKICNLPTAIAAAAALALLTMPDFVAFSRLMHPDTLQTLFVVAALGLALLRPTFSFALMAALAAGLAFSTKYVGAVVLPFTFLPLALSTLGREQLSRRVLLRLYLQGLALIGVFVAVFALTNPYAARDRSGFFHGFIWQLKYSADGYDISGAASPALWLKPLAEQFGIVGVLYLFGGFFLACALLLRDIRRAGWRPACGMDGLRSEFVLVLYVLATSAHLAISIHQREARFIYHVVPFLIIVSTLAFYKLAVELTKRVVPPPSTATAFAAMLLIFAATQIGFDLQAMAGANAKPASPLIKFGDFVAQHYPPETRILADAYTYLPPALTNVTFTNLQTEEQLANVKPEVIILTHLATGSYVWKQPGTAFSEGKFVKDLRYPATPQVEIYLNKLLSTASGWSVVRESDFEVLLQRSR